MSRVVEDVVGRVENPLRTLTVRGQGATECNPDKFQITVLLTSSKASIEEAEANVKKRSDYVLQVLRNHGMNSECVKLHTTVTQDDQQQVNSIRTSVKVLGWDFDRISQARGVVLEKLGSSAQCSNINCSITFKQQMAQREEAFRLAVTNAKSKGVSVAKCLGVALGPVVTLVEDSIEERPLVAIEEVEQQHDVAVNSTIVISCDVTAVFELYIDNKKS